MRIESERNPRELVLDQPLCDADHAVFFRENTDES